MLADNDGQWTGVLGVAYVSAWPESDPFNYQCLCSLYIKANGLFLTRIGAQYLPSTESTNESCWEWWIGKWIGTSCCVPSTKSPIMNRVCLLFSFWSNNQVIRWKLTLNCHERHWAKSNTIYSWKCVCIWWGASFLESTQCRGSVITYGIIQEN